MLAFSPEAAAGQWQVSPWGDKAAQGCVLDQAGKGLKTP